MAKILIVDDDAEVLGTTWRALTREGFETSLADSAAQALEFLEKERPNLMILDIVMPEMDGLELCKILRADAKYADLPILFLSARGQTDDVVNGLDAGGDDYIVKPFDLAELRARVRALLRRALGVDEQSSKGLVVGDLQLDPKTYRAKAAEDEVQLTSTEYRLLEQLMKNAGQVLSVDRLLESVWDYPQGTGDPNLVRAHIRNLRQKLEPDPTKPQFVRTVHGLGYVVAEDDEAS